MIIESVAEDLKIKQDLFKELDQICPLDTVLATNTSVISITDIAAKSKNKGRIVGAHSRFPPFLIPLVEVVKGNETSDETMELTFQFMKKAGKYPIKCMKDVPGFVANRLQHALWREAISIVENGIADAATVDAAIKNSFGIRLAVLGPMENSDMAGLDLILAIHNTVLKDPRSVAQSLSPAERKGAEGWIGFSKRVKAFIPNGAGGYEEGQVETS